MTLKKNFINIYKREKYKVKKKQNKEAKNGK